MSATEIIRRAQAEGVALSLNGDRLRLEAERPPSADLLAELKAHKVELIEALKTTEAICTCSAWIDRSAPAEQQQAVSVEQYVVHTAATASPAWQEVRDLFYDHIFACRACYAPLERYCTAGADLRQQYDNTPMELAR